MIVIIMCKAPLPGKVKTRLAVEYGEEGAAALHQKMAEMVIRRVMDIFPIVWLAADDPSHPFFTQVPCHVVAQGEGDLGARMCRLMHQGFDEGADAVLFLGTDSPHMPGLRLLEAQDALREYDVVIGPVEDGGYDLIGMAAPCDRLFYEIPWSSSHVFTSTLSRVAENELSVECLEVGFDIDTPEDFRRAFPEGLPASLTAESEASK